MLPDTPENSLPQVPGTTITQRARHLAQHAAEVRADKVEAARRALQQGTLPLSGEDLAAALLRHLRANDTAPRR